MYSLCSLSNLCYSQNIPDYVSTEGLVLWMPFEGNANDYSGYENNGIVNGATLTQGREGTNNSAYDFINFNDNIQIPASESLNLSTISFSCWIKPRSLHNFLSNIVKKGNYYNASNEAFAFGLRAPNSTFLAIKNGATCTPGSGWLNDLQPSSSPLVNTWSHIVYIYDQGTMSVYINGNLNSSVYIGGNISYCNNEDLSIGQEWINRDVFDGVIDNIGIWNRSLNECEILNLFNENILEANLGVTHETSYNSNDGIVTSSPIGGNPPFTYNWSNGENTTTISNLPPSTYTLTLEDNDGCQNIESIVVEPFTCPDIEVQISDCSLVYNGYLPSECVDLESYVLNGIEPFTFEWSNGESTPTINVCPIFQTIYTLTVTDANGCSIEANTTVFVEDISCGNNEEKVEICHNGNTICVSPAAIQNHLDHGDIIGACDIQLPCIPIESRRKFDNSSSKDVIVFPNPVLNKLIIQANEERFNQYYLFDLSGRILLSGNIENNLTTVNVEKIIDGTYILKIVGGSEMKTKKFIKIGY